MNDDFDYLSELGFTERTVDDAYVKNDCIIAKYRHGIWSIYICLGLEHRVASTIELASGSLRVCFLKHLSIAMDDVMKFTAAVIRDAELVHSVLDQR